MTPIELAQAALLRIQRAIGDARSTLGNVLVPEIPLWSQFGRIGGSLTPADVTQIVREADGGTPRRLVDLVHECRQKDGHMQAVLGLRELAISGLEWSVEDPYKAKNDEIEAARLCGLAIDRCENFHVMLAHLTGEGALFPTGAWAELIWGFHELGELRGLECPKLINPINSRRFGFRREDGHLVFVPEGRTPDNGGVDLLAAYDDGNFICHQPRINGDARVREGLARVFVWMAVFRNWDIRDWLLAGELGWKPWRIASFKKNADEDDIAFAEKLIQTITSTGAGMKPDTVDLDVLFPKSTGSNYQTVHNELAEFFGMEMSKAAIGQTLTVEATVRGARALGQVHDAVRKDIRESDAVGIEAAINRYIVEPFYAFNFPGVRRGSFRFNTDDGVDMEKVGKVVNMIASYVDIPQSWVRDQIGSPEPKKGEPICQARPAIDDPNQDATDGDDGEEAPDASGNNYPEEED